MPEGPVPATAPIQAEHEPNFELARRLVRSALGPDARVEAFQPIGSWSLARLIINGWDHPSVIIKWLRNHPAGFRTDPGQMVTEYSALRFLGQISPGLAPAVLGADLSVPALLMEDLVGSRSLLELLMDRATEAEAGLMSFATALAELHLATLGQARAYYQDRGRLGSVDPHFELRRFFEPLPSLGSIGERLDVPVDPPAARDLQLLVEELVDPGPFSALSNGDSGANNFLIGPGGHRLIDFEAAGFRHCLTDVVCLYVPGPQWMAVGDPGQDGSESLYRGLLAEHVPEAADDERYGVGVAASGLTYALMRLGRFGVAPV